MEAKAYKDVTEYDVIKFIKETIVHRFGLPQSITMDNGMTFNGLRFWLLHKSMTLKSLTLHHTMHKQMGKQNLPTRSSKPI